MCGIAGFVSRTGAEDISTLWAMCNQIRHRGPDDQGYRLEDGCGLGMRRLSIIDLATGHQPMSNEDGSVWVVFNGEIYNFQSLRTDLIAGGHHFSTTSDTEALVHLYEDEGTESISRLRGMFAFAIWDARARRLLLARDRFGKKPLYYAVLPQGLYFASELKSLRAVGIPLDLDHEALRLYFQFSYIPDPRTPFRSVRKLEPGTWLTYDADGSLHDGRYWRLAAPVAESPPAFSESDACAAVREAFDEAVRIRMLADVPVGAFLSGGVDSSSVVASMARQSGQEPVRTFSVGFEESGFNELPYAAAVARHFRTDHHEIIVRPNAVDLVTRLVEHFDEPFGDASAIPTFIVSQFAAEHVKVALSGDGGDELFGGYDSFLLIQKRRWLDRVPQAIRRSVSQVADWLPYAAYGKNFLRMASRPSAFERYFESTYAPYYLRRELLEPDWMLPADAAFLTRTFVDRLLPEGADPLLQAMYFEATSKLPGDMLVKIDRMSMAHSLELRCPLLDHPLAELAATIPSAWKLRHGKGKFIFARAVGDRLPSEVLQREKMGFGVPLAAWFRGPLRTFLWDNLTDVAFLNRGIVSERFVRHLLEEHTSGRRDNNHWLWSILMFELWLRTLNRAE